MKKQSQIPANVSTNNLKNSWPLLPLGILFFFCLYTITLNVNGLGYLATSPLSIFTQPAFAAAMIAAFCLTYAYSVMRRAPLRPLAKAAAYVMSGWLVVALAFMMTLPSDACSFAAGAPNCSDAQYLRFWLVFFNPVSSTLLEVLSLTGILALTLKRK